MKKTLASKQKKDSSRQGRTVTKDNAGHTIEEIYGVHIINRDDIEHHRGVSEKKSGEINQKSESSGSPAKSVSKKTKSNDDSNDTE